MNGQTNGADLHFRRGLTGWLARFFMARRAAGDPFDATLVVPSVIFLVLVRLNDLGRVDARAVIAGLVIPASIAGCWIGAAVGINGQGRAMLRAVLVGAIEAAASVAMVKKVIGKHEALRNAFDLIYINFVLFWFFSLITSTFSEIFIQSEREWKIGAARRAKIGQSVRGILSFIWQSSQSYVANDLFKAVLSRR